MISQERLKELVHYDPDTGKVIWIKSNGRRAIVGKEIGSEDNKGYRITKIDGKWIHVHRLIWIYMTGSLPTKEIVDHIDSNTKNNKWNNLREATRQENYRNVPARNKLGVKGVCKIRNRYYATITVNRTSIPLGKFDNLEDAANAYKEAATKYHGEFLHNSLKDK